MKWRDKLDQPKDISSLAIHGEQKKISKFPYFLQTFVLL